MTMSRFALTLLAALSCVNVACTATPEAPAATPIAPKAASFTSTTSPQADYRPALWSVEHQGRRSWLFGALPWSEPGISALPAPVQDALSQSDQLASELRMPVSPTEVAPLLAALRKPGASFRAGLPAELGTELDQMCQQQSLPCSALDSLPPFFVVAALHKLMAQKAGLQNQEPQSSMGLVHRAMKDKPLLELEGLQAGFQLLQSIPEADQQALLRRLLVSQGQDSVQSYAAWRRGDMAALQAKVESSAFTPATRERVQRQRDQAWSLKIAQRLREGQRLFVAVAPGHLGSEGLPTLLQAQGFKVERVAY